MDEEEMMMWANDFVEEGERDELFATGNSGGGCFIATAAYGTPLAEEIDILCNWRDNCLLQSGLGRIFVDAYYNLSPPIANHIKVSKVKAQITRKIIEPFVKILSEKYR